MILHEDLQVLCAAIVPSKIHLHNVVAVVLRSSKDRCSEIVIHCQLWEVDQVLYDLNLVVLLSDTLF